MNKCLNLKVRKSVQRENKKKGCAKFGNLMQMIGERFCHSVKMKVETNKNIYSNSLVKTLRQTFWVKDSLKPSHIKRCCIFQSYAAFLFWELFEIT